MMYKKLCVFLLCMFLLVLLCTASGCSMIQSILNGEDLTVQYRGEVVTAIEVVTDASGEAVTDEEGCVVTVVIEIDIEDPDADPSGEVRTRRPQETERPGEPGTAAPKDTEKQTNKGEPVTEPVGWDDNLKQIMKNMYEDFHKNGHLSIGGWATPASALRDGYTETEGSYDAAYRKLADAGLDYMITLEEWSSPSWSLESLSSAKKAGMKLWYNCAGQDAEYSLEKIRAMLASPDADALAAVYVKDEPTYDAIPELAEVSETIRNGINEGRTEKERIPVFSNLLPTYAPEGMVTSDYRGYVKTYLDTVKPDVLMFDYYPYQGKSGDKLAEMCANLAVAQEEARSAGVDMYTFIQSSGQGASLREPNAAELRADINLNLAFGAKSIAYFLTCEHYEGWDYSCILNAKGETTPLYETIRAVNEEVSHTADPLSCYRFSNVIVRNWAGMSRAMKMAGCSLETDTFGLLTDVNVSDNRRCVIGCFDGFAGYIGLYVVNPDYNREIDVTLHFGQASPCAAWGSEGMFECDQVMEMTTHLAPGGAAFVVIVDTRSE